MASVLSAFRDNEEKVAAAVAECRRLGIEVRPPYVGRSQVEFTVEDEAIRFGLLAVKNVGQGAIESIIAAREAEGAVQVDRRPLPADRPAPREPQGAGVARQGRRAQLVRASGPDPRGPRRRHRRRRRHAARPRDGPDVAVRRRRRRVDGLERPLPNVPEAPCASGSAGRRSCSACTSPSTRWARSPSRSGTT